MDKEIKDTILGVYINHWQNQATNEEIVKKMKHELEDMLSQIKNISVSISIPHDPEYKRIEYDENCAVALDIFVYVPNNEHAMVVQISKLGKFAWFYWKLWKPYESFIYEMPEGWPNEVPPQIIKTIQEYGVRFLTQNEMNERFEAVYRTYSADTGYVDEPATVRELLFCCDGPH